MAFVKRVLPRSLGIIETCAKIVQSGHNGATKRVSLSTWYLPQQRRYSLPEDLTACGSVLASSSGLRKTSVTPLFVATYRYGSTAQAIKSSLQDPDQPLKVRSKKHEVTQEELSNLLSKGPSSVCLIDVREPQEIQESGSIPGSINIPLANLKASLQMEPSEFTSTFGVARPNKDDAVTPIIFYGLSGVRSSTALEIAHKLGFKKARHYPGGWVEWCSTDNPKH